MPLILLLLLLLKNNNDVSGERVFFELIVWATKITTGSG
jgi:hypothetical protein